MISAASVSASIPDRSGIDLSHLDIQGLRAVAVSAVVVFHLRGLLPGGFLGVDVFFVISGYVITASLAREIDETGEGATVGILRPESRRLLPALSVMTTWCGDTWVRSSCSVRSGAGQALVTTARAASVSVANFNLYGQFCRYSSLPRQRPMRYCTPGRSRGGTAYSPGFALVVALAVAVLGARRRSLAVLSMVLILGFDVPGSSLTASTVAERNLELDPVRLLLAIQPCIRVRCWLAARHTATGRGDAPCVSGSVTGHCGGFVAGVLVCRDR